MYAAGIGRATNSTSHLFGHTLTSSRQVLVRLFRQQLGGGLCVKEELSHLENLGFRVRV
jgi:hypothetical protein